MSRDLDLDNLDQDDLAYLAQRPLLVQEIIAATGEDPLENYEPEQEGGPVANFNRPNETGTIVAGSATVQVPGNLDVNRGTGPEDDPKAWDESMKKKELRAVIDARNEDYDDDNKIEPEGTTNADLVAALEEDDRRLTAHNSNLFPEGDPNAEQDEEDEDSE